MATTPRSPLAGLPPGLARHPDEHIVAGVCAGVARWLGVDPIVVRLAAVILALANGVGVVAYVVAWVVLPEAAARGSSGRRGRARRGRSPSGTRRRGRPRNASWRWRSGCITFGAAAAGALDRAVLPRLVVWPAALAAVGIGLVLARAGDGIDAATGGSRPRARTG